MEILPCDEKILDLLKSKLVPDLDIARHRGRTHEISQTKLLNVNHSRWESFVPD